jgi:hypothetical protein
MTTAKRPAPDRSAGPTRERLQQADHGFEIGGDAREGYRFTMTDNPLGRALTRRKISEAEYSALRKYAAHWHAAGLAGHVVSLDLNRVSSSRSSLFGSEAATYHLNEYREAARYIGRQHAYVADNVACFETKLETIGEGLGYASPYRGRQKALELLREAGDRLAYHWNRRRR